MNLRLLPVLLFTGLGLVLTGCATFDKTELGLIRGSGISPRLYAKMQHGDELTPEDVIELHRRHVPDRYVLRQIDDAGVDYLLSPEDFKKLKRSQVSPAVVDALITASADFSERYAAPSRFSYYGSYGYPYDDAYYGYGPDYYPYGGIGIGVYSDRRWGGGHHHHHHR